IPLLLMPWQFADRRRRFLLLTVAFFCVGLLFITWPGARLAAPITGAVIILFVDGFRRLRTIKMAGVSAGRLLAWSIVIIATLSFSYDFLGRLKDTTPQWYFQRARIRHQLEKDGRQHLVIVRYGTAHWPLQEWVYNEADIDRAKVVWARD